MSADASRDNPGSPSPTPVSEPAKNKARCVVRLLDGETFQTDVQRKAKVEVLIDEVMSHLKVEDRDYFGLYYAFKEQRFFLDPLKSGARQYPGSREPQWILHFGVKYYVPDPHLLKDELTKYLYCLQLRQDIREERVLLDPASDPALQLAALTVQASLGDYDPEQHGEGYTHKYLEFLYGSESAIAAGAEDRVRAVHQEKRELTPAECDNEFLMIAKDLPRYGKHLFNAKEVYEDRSVEIGAGYTGISVYYETKLATDYPWPIINKLLYHGRRFKIRYHPEDDLEHWEIKKHKFDATETRWSKRIWKECVEQHTFFRLAVPGEPPLPIPQFIPQFGRNSKLRFSGRTLAQMRLHNKPSPGVSFPRPPPADPKEPEIWTRPRSASPANGNSAGSFNGAIPVEPVHPPTIYGHHVAMISFPYDDTPSPWLQYRIVVRNGHKIFQKELGAPASAPPTPAYRLRWAYIHNARMDPGSHQEGGVAMLQPLRPEGRRPVNVQAADDYHTSTESLEASATNEFMASQHPVPPRIEAEV